MRLRFKAVSLLWIMGSTLLSTSLSLAQVREAWVAHYPEGSGFAMVIDGQGNLYIVGSISTITRTPDILTLKYDASDGTHNSITSPDYATIKYNSNGRQLWVSRYNEPNDHEDIATELAVDSQGNVYVAGVSVGDYLTVKHDANGNELWTARYNSPNNRAEVPSALAVDDQGNVYVTGATNLSSPPSPSDYLTVKYDTNGNLLWAARYNGPGNRGDEANALAVDRQGNVYVTGFSDPDSDPDNNNEDYLTVKYDRNGNQVWVARYSTPGNERDIARAAAVDNRSNVYVTAGSSSGPFGSCVTIKYVQSPPSDVNNDGCVNDRDLTAVLLIFGQLGEGRPEDVDEDGVIDRDDLAFILSSFGFGC